MERFISSPPPSPLPRTLIDNLDASFWGFLRHYGLQTAELGVLMAMFLMICQFVLGSRRRYIHDTWQGGCIHVLYTLNNICIPYLITLMHRYLGLTLFSTWEGLLIFVYGGSDTMTAYNLSDNDRLHPLIFSFLPLLFRTDRLIQEAGFDLEDDFVFFFHIICHLTILNATDTLGALTVSSKSCGLAKITALMDRYMRTKFNNYDEADDPMLTPRGYSFLVDGNIDAPKKIVSTLQVWQCEGQLLNPSTGNDYEDSSHKRSGWLKDMCLSNALFNILLTRFGGYSLPESSRHDLRRFIKEGLCGGGQIQDRAFSIIEVELEFLFDFFYTKFYYLGNRKSLIYQFNPLWAIALCLWGYTLLTPLKIGVQHGHYLEVGNTVTRVMVLLISVLLAVQLCMRIFSNWIIVKLIFLYVRKPKKSFLAEKVIIFISNIKIYLLATESRHLGMLKPCKRKLGQYTLLESYDHVPLRKRLFRCIGRVGKKESPPVTLSVQVKRAVLSSFAVADYGSALSRGKTSLSRNGMGHLSDLFDEQDTTDAHFILAWHIATSVCEHFSSTEPAQVRSRKGDKNFHIATQLSKYCAYLLDYAPELVSSFPATTLATFDGLIKHARDTFKGTKNMEERCIKLLELATDNVEDTSDIFGRVAVLSNHLKDLVLKKPNRGWRVMAEFWAELILYLAPTENATVHAERLAKGGEFITHLWALLTHAGIFSRASFQPTLFPSM